MTHVSSGSNLEGLRPTLNRATSVRHVFQDVVPEASLLLNSNKLAQTDTETDAYIPLEGFFPPLDITLSGYKIAFRPTWEGSDHRKNSMPLSDCEYADVR